MKRLVQMFTMSICTLVCLAGTSSAQDANSKMLKLVPEVHRAVDKDAKRVQETYKDIHEHKVATVLALDALDK